MNSPLGKNRASVILPTLTFGLLWGLVEMSLGGFLHLVHFPQKGALLGGIAFILMTSFVAVTKRPGLVPWLGLIAAACKFLDVLWPGISLVSPAVVNPATAILVEALIFSGIAAAVLRYKSYKAMAVQGAEK